MDNFYFEINMDMILNSTLQEAEPDNENIEGYYSLDDLDLIPEDDKIIILDDVKRVAGLKDPVLCGIDFNFSYNAIEDELKLNLNPAFYDRATDSEPDSTLLDPYDVDIPEEVKNKILEDLGIDKISKIDYLIEEVQAIRDQGDNGRPWIYERDENNHGTLRKDVMVADIMPILEELRGYEIFCTKEQIDAFRNSEDVENMYTYNNSGKVDRDFSIWYKEGSPMGLFCIHTGRDARVGFTDFVPFATPDYTHALEGILYFESIEQHKDVGDGYIADINATKDMYDVYDYNNDEYIGEFSDSDIDSLKQDMAELLEEQQEEK